MSPTQLAKGFLEFAAAVAFVAGSPPPAEQPDPVYDPLWLYNGTWASSSTPDGKHDTIANDCSRVGRYFMCQQTVDGTVASLIVFVPGENQRGQYATQSINADGYAGGRGKLMIDGEHWTYTSEDRSKGATIFYRTTNTFTGKNKIHFEQATSENGTDWTVTRSGDEIRHK